MTFAVSLGGVEGGEAAFAVGMPGGVDGKALSDQTRLLRPSLPVLITTAYAAGALIHDGRLDRGIDLLVKPFTFGTLAARVREVVDRPRPQAGESRILVVEDEVLVRLYLSQTLRELGCEIEEAGSASEAMHKLAAGDHLDAAILDLGLPDRPGDELAREMRRTRPDLPIVFATGHADRIVRERVAGLSAVQVLEKPFHRADIETAFARLGISVGL